MLVDTGGGEVGGATATEGGACSSAFVFARRKSSTHMFLILWEGRRSAY